MKSISVLCWLFKESFSVQYAYKPGRAAASWIGEVRSQETAAPWIKNWRPEEGRSGGTGIGTATCSAWVARASAATLSHSGIERFAHGTCLSR